MEHAGRAFLAIAVPYAAIAIFLAGFCYRVLRWAWTPVPFRIPTTCGQQKSLPWIKSNSARQSFHHLGRIGPHGARGSDLPLAVPQQPGAAPDKNRLVFGENKYLWLGSLAFHWALLIILLRHLRLLVEPVPAFVLALQHVDGFFQIAAPDLYAHRRGSAGGLVYLLRPQAARSAGPLHFALHRLLRAVSAARHRHLRAC